MSNIKLDLPPFARRLMGAEEEPPDVLDLEGADYPERAPSADDPGGLGYSLALKRKRHGAILRHMLQQAGMHDLARMTAIREDHGGEHD